MLDLYIFWILVLWHGLVYGLQIAFPSRSFSSVQLLSCVQLFAALSTEAHQASLSITNSQSLLQTRIHWVSDAIQPSHPLSSPTSPPAFCLCQHWGLIIIQKMFWPRITLIHCRFVSYICFLLREWPRKLFQYILFLCSWHFHSSLLHHISSSHLCDVIIQKTW